MKNWYATEEMAAETRKAIEEEIEIEKRFAQSFGPLISEVKRLASRGDPASTKLAIDKLMEIKNTSEWKALPSSTQEILEKYLNMAYNAKTVFEFLKYVKNIEKLLKSLK
jgi:hypothetical protein